MDQLIAYSTLALAISTTLLALFTLGLMLFTFRLWKTTGEVVREARETAERQLRAYLAVGAEIENVDNGKPPHARISVKNHGQTPAYELTHKAGIGLGRSFDTLSIASSPSAINRASMPPGHLHQGIITAPRPLSPDEISRLKAGELTLWVYGEARFKDAFHAKRFLRFRFMTGGPVGVSGERLAVCGEGNEEN